jgi:hypothetical protein
LAFDISCNTGSCAGVGILAAHEQTLQKSTRRLTLMPNKFPHLKSTSEPLGPVEQLGMAVTVNPAEDSAREGRYSWFGNMLHEDFTFFFQAGGGKWHKANKKEMVDAYFLPNGTQQLSFTAYGWKSEHSCIDESSGVGIVQGKVTIKGHCKLGGGELDTSRDLYFLYWITKEEGSKWRVRQWRLSPNELEKCHLDKFNPDELGKDSEEQNKNTGNSPDSSVAS